MYLLNKHIHPENFTFPNSRRGSRFSAEKKAYTLRVDSTADDIFRISVANRSLWPHDPSHSGLAPLLQARSDGRGTNARLSLSSRFGLSLTDSRGKTILTSLPEASLGLCGNSWLFAFSQPKSMRFYGMGEKSTPFEKSDRVHKFWNVDVYADHGAHKAIGEHYDPDYLSVPYLIVKQGNTYVGLLVDSPYCGVIATSRRIPSHLQVGSTALPGMFYLGAENGAPSLYVIYGPSLPELTRKLQGLVGHSPLPPLWALGYHQSRWGYQSRQELEVLQDAFRRRRYPVDGLWLDIEYMDGYRLFTFDRKNFPHPQSDLEAIQARGCRVVPIIDPGIKREMGYPVYADGRRRDIFCHNSGGREFVGFVWPGETVFPDFSLDEARRWWAKQIERFARLGIHAAWLDMNDPSTGSADCTEMLFNRGRLPHDTHHNQYALLMAAASREGFEAAWPNERIFLLSRSGFTGSQKFTAHWTGDNASNYHHLAMSIPKSLNLALSGMPHNGPDLGGFAEDADAQLMIDWVKVDFLFPFMRNHCARGRRAQEPWAFTSKVLKIMRFYTRLRYKLLPYLYNLFVEHERSGEAILRPLFYDFADTRTLPLGGVDDQFMVGPAIMQAPFTKEKQSRRPIVIPAGRWYRADTGSWINGGRTITATKSDQTTPIFLRDGTVVPMQRGVRTDNRNELNRIELLICATPETPSSCRYCYSCDDGLTMDYRRGRRSTFDIHARADGTTLSIEISTRNQGYGSVDWLPVTLFRFKTLTLSIDGHSTALRSTRRTTNLFGTPDTFYYWQR